MIKITAMTPQSQWRTFSLFEDDLEVTYEVLNRIVQQGDTLVNVTLVDAHGYLPLPLMALEKPDFLNPIKALKQEWEALLAQPNRGYLSRDEFHQRLLGLRQVRILSTRRAIDRLQELLERTKPYTKSGLRKDELLDHYQRILDGYSRLLVRLETDSFWQKLVKDAF